MSSSPCFQAIVREVGTSGSASQEMKALAPSSGDPSEFRGHSVTLAHPGGISFGRHGWADTGFAPQGQGFQRDMFRRYKILVDGARVASVQEGESATVNATCAAPAAA